MPTTPIRTRSLATLLVLLALLPSTSAFAQSVESERLDQLPAPEDGFCELPLLVSDLFKDIGHNVELQAIALTQSAVDVEAEIRIGAIMHEHFVWQFGPYLDAEPDLVGYLNALMKDVLPYTSRPDLDWQVHVISDPTPNAFAAPGGYIYVMTGLIDMAENEAQLMGVLAHEVGHEQLRHPVSTIQYLELLGVWDLDNPKLAMQILPVFKLPFSSRLEQAADLFAVRVLFELGYSPYQFHRMYQAMEYMDSETDPAIEGSFAQVFLEETRNLIESHPRARLRSCAIIDALELYTPGREQLELYRGALNLERRIPMSQERF